MEPLLDDPEVETWAARQPVAVTGDPLWRLAAYRHAAYSAECARLDAERLARDRLRVEIAAQLLRCATSVAANIAEGYGRPTTVDRIRFMSFALGSVREAVAWYQAAAGAIDDEVREDRVSRLARVRRMLIGLIRRLRTKTPRTIDRW